MNTNRQQAQDDEPPRENITRAAPNDDLPDSPHDAERLQGDKTTLNLPDVDDIPGQEFVQVPSLGEIADTTISSADEEGEGLLDYNTNEEGEPDE
jgi:hypothetical protein